MEDAETIPPSAQGDPSIKAESQGSPSQDNSDGEYKYETEFSLDDSDGPSDDHSQYAASESSRSRLDSDPPDPYRPNKFKGAASIWLDWTAEARNTATSLERLKAQDLSVHLYNTYALRSRAKRLKNEGNSLQSVWEPPKKWAAWPMDITQVPQTSSVSLPNFHGVRRSTSLAKINSESRRNLQEELRACYTRTARKIFEAKKTKNVSGNEGCDSLKENPDQHSNRSGDPARDTSRQQSIQPSDADLESTLPGPAVLDPDGRQSDDPTAEAKGKVELSTSSKSREGGRVETDPVKKEMHEAIPLADDDATMHIVLPTINHLVSSVEVLLNGLRQARQQKQNKKHIPSRKRKVPRLASPPSPPRISKARPRLRAEADPELSSDSALSSSGSLHEEAKSLSPVSTSSQSSPFATNDIEHERRRTDWGQKRGLQDWRDVLGVAAIQGWNAAAIERAQSRCCKVFEEPFQIEHLDFGNAFEHSKLDTYTVVPDEEHMDGGVHVDGFLRPIYKRVGWHSAEGNWNPWHKGKSWRALVTEKHSEDTHNESSDLIDSTEGYSDISETEDHSKL